jgi:hypothetical protein
VNATLSTPGWDASAERAQLADHLPVQLAGVVDLQPGQPLGVLRNEVAEAVQQRGAGEPGHRAPLAVERRAGGGHRDVDVLGSAVGHHRPCLAGVGVLRPEGRPGQGVDGLAADQHAELLELACHGAVLLDVVPIEDRTRFCW